MESSVTTGGPPARLCAGLGGGAALHWPIWLGATSGRHARASHPEGPSLLRPSLQFNRGRCLTIHLVSPAWGGLHHCCSRLDALESPSHLSVKGTSASPEHWARLGGGG